LRRRIRNYEGPRAGFAFTAEGLMPLSEPRAILALTDSALLLSLGPTSKADEYRRLAQKRDIRAAA
jgi:hypothetical protein